MRIVKILILFFVSLMIMSCDSTYRYLFMPSEHITYTLVPDSILIQSSKDSAYSVSKDGLNAIYDKKDFKVEIKYLSDYHLNNIEFPEDSRGGPFSTNPFTYANWIDPNLGYTPNRFSVFKVTIYNYAAPKINIDPENILLISDRGDNLHSYGKEEKTSRYQNLETYFKRRTGSSGVQDDIFEGRMGIVRNTVLSLWKPIFRGDIRQGLVVFDPLAEEVERIKLTIPKFITDYDENNEPGGFININFYFKRIPFIPPKTLQTAEGQNIDSSNIFILPTVDPKKLTELVPIAQLKYPATNITGGVQEYWNPAPEALSDLSKYVNNNTQLKITNSVIDIESKELKSSKIAVIFGQGCTPALTDSMVNILTNYIKSGGFLLIDNGDATIASSFGQTMDKVLLSISDKIGSDARYQKIPMSNPAYSLWQKFKSVPPGHELYSNETLREQTVDYLEGLFIKGKIVAILSHKGYGKAWGLWRKGGRDIDNTQQLNLGLNFIMYAIISNMKSK